MSGSTGKCHVFLFGTEIEEGKAGKALQVIAPPLMCLQHWSVVFKYDDGNVAVCEANPDKKGTLVGHFSWKAADHAEKVEANKVSLGNHTIPSERVVSVMRDMNRGTKYILYRNNCQSWVKELLQRLNIPCPVTAFTDTPVGQQINKVVDIIEGGSESEEENPTTKTTTPAGTSQRNTPAATPSASKGKKGSKRNKSRATPQETPQGTPSRERARGAGQRQAEGGTRAAPLAFVGAAATAAAAAVAGAWNRYRGRRRPHDDH
ncbi:uncharacterized protein LOC135387406 [Ornithodoros turicata]|uniref:uncharacterized protein LOC135387406 n=1 Tax=Ornithodoros turicata TaxID=34597 RepID=UPI003138789B